MKLTTSILLIVFLMLSCQPEPKFVELSGPIFGTTYNIKYQAPKGENYQKSIDDLFNSVNKSLSTYIKNSDISLINAGKVIQVDSHFVKVFKASKLIYRQTEGAFDPTIGNIVNAWNFGAETNKFETDSSTIDSLMRFVGLNRVGIVNSTIKKPKTSYLEFNAIAKGYGIDVVADFLKQNGVTDYLVDIGGDMVVSGIHTKKQKPWSVGINDPNFDDSQSYSKVISLQNQAMATSGTYRKFKLDQNGKRYAHIINTKTGYPTKTNILSVSVIAPTAMLADGYATAFQAMGIDKVKHFLLKHPELKVYFIYETETMTLKTLALNGFPE